MNPSSISSRSIVLRSTLIAILRLVAPTAGAAEPDEAALFRTKIEPVLVAECYRCHSAKAEKVKGGLLLDSRAGMLRGGDTGPAIVPGKAAESLLVQALQHVEGLAMPPKGPKLAATTIADFERWVNAGAVDPREALASSSPLDESRKHWAFQPVEKVIPPKVQGEESVRNPIDAFLVAKLETHGWGFAPAASRTEWLRRVTFDLTGLPPSPEEIDSFLDDPSPTAYERVVDRLLDSPRYGERWGQHWLDLARYAETEGYEYDREIPGAWRYRDYVIDALNHDKPFDRFLTEQLAGDEIKPGDPECQTASTFHRLGPVRRNAGNSEIALSRNEVLTERTDIIGTAFLGLTVGCARCHNHKLEPILQKDYYRLQAYLAATEENNIVLADEPTRKAWEAKSKTIKDVLVPLKQRAKGAVGADRARLTAEVEALEETMPPALPTIPGTRNDMDHRTAVHVLRRGVWENKGEPVGPRPLSVLVPDNQSELPPDVANPRTELARWLTDPGHPLTSRVIVNRIWQHHFGVGLVKTVNDFGTKGDRPSHPDLLDWLAATLVGEGWRLKPLHRLMVLSNAYRQSGRSPTASTAERTDPENRLLWRFGRRRLSAEEIRDSMLMSAGRLNLKAGGPSVMVPVDPELTRLLYKPSQWVATRDKTEYDRRTIYLVAKRNLRLPFMETFDAPALQSACARREQSTHAPQALEMLNGRLANDLAQAFALRLEADTGGKPDQIVDRAFRLALGRPPTAEERALSLQFLRDQPTKEFALAVFNLNGFLYVP